MDAYTVISSPTCPWCDKVKALLDENLIKYESFSTQDAEIKRFLLANNLTTVPQVFHNGHLIGGYEKTKEYLDAGMPRLPVR